MPARILHRSGDEGSARQSNDTQSRLTSITATMRKVMSWNVWMRTLVVSAAALGLIASQAVADPWPQRTVRIIVPIGAGAGTDVAARLYAERLSARWKQPVIVENRPGADGLIGVAAFAAMRDDHTLLYSFAAPISVYPVLQEKLPYDAARDVVPISWGAGNFLVVAAAQSSKIASLRELFTLTRSKPGKLNYNGGAGAIPYVFAGFLKSQGLDMVQVSYRELNLAVQDLAEGRLDIMLTGVTPSLPLVQAGKVRLLAVTNGVRTPMAPEVPTVIEAGYPDLAFDGGSGFFGPRDMPTEVLERIAADIRAVADDPMLANRLTSVGQIARSSTPAEFSAALAEERARMTAIVKLIGIKPTP
jgi:tripartite-type tricarboxylate transporter receptor subunit TctC